MNVGVFVAAAQDGPDLQRHDAVALVGFNHVALSGTHHESVAVNHDLRRTLHTLHPMIEGVRVKARVANRQIKVHLHTHRTGLDADGR